MNGTRGGAQRRGLLDNDFLAADAQDASAPPLGLQSSFSGPSPEYEVLYEPMLEDAETLGVERVDLSTRKLSYSVMMRKPGDNRWLCGNRVEKMLVKPVDLHLRAGELVALVGPSGAGKTTLLNMLAGRNHRSGIVRGDILVNGETAPPSFKRISCFIPQDDVLLSGLSPRETLHYAARLKLRGPVATTDKRVDEILRDLRLEECADTLVGNVDKKGLSGGQRKRTSIGLELITNPSLVFVDEATSGLDSKMAEDVVQILSDLARSGRLVVCTIHQPSIRIFRMFEKCILLAKGQLVYSGRVDQAQEYFRLEHGLETDAADNPADAYMRWLQTDSILEQILAHIAAHPGNDSQPASDSSDLSGRASFSGTEMMSRQTSRESAGSKTSQASIFNLGHQWHYPRSKWEQTIILTKRAFLDVTKDPSKFLRGIVFRCCVGLMVGAVWFGQAGDTLESTTATESVFFISSFNVMQDTLVNTLLTVPLMKSLIQREYQNGYYCLPAWFASNAVVSHLTQFIISLVFGVPLYLLIGLKPSVYHLGVYIAVLVFEAWISYGIGLTIGAFASDLLEAQGLVAPLLVPLILFAGFLLPYETIPVYFRPFYWASFLQYGLSILQINEYEGKVFTDCDIDAAPEVCQVFVQCFETGEEFLESRNNDTSNLERNFAILGSMHVVFLFATYYALRYAVRCC